MASNWDAHGAWDDGSGDGPGGGYAQDNRLLKGDGSNPEHDQDLGGGDFGYPQFIQPAYHPSASPLAADPNAFWLGVAGVAGVGRQGGSSSDTFSQPFPPDAPGATDPSDLASPSGQTGAASGSQGGSVSIGQLADQAIKRVLGTPKGGLDHDTVLDHTADFLTTAGQGLPLDQYGDLVGKAVDVVGGLPADEAGMRAGLASIGGAESSSAQSAGDPDRLGDLFDVEGDDDFGDNGNALIDGPEDGPAALTPPAISGLKEFFDDLRRILGITDDESPTSTPAPPSMVKVEPQARVGVVREYPETGKAAWRAANDQVFTDAANAYNAKYGLRPGDPGYRTPGFVKAWAMVESGGDRHAFETDPLQVNKTGDYAREKPSIIGLTKNENMTPEKSARAALEWLRYKSQIHDSRHRVIRTLNDHDALARYNAAPGYTDGPHPILKSDWYARRVLNLAGSVAR